MELGEFLVTLIQRSQRGKACEKMELIALLRTHLRLTADHRGSQDAANGLVRTVEEPVASSHTKTDYNNDSGSQPLCAFAGVIRITTTRLET